VAQHADHDAADRIDQSDDDRGDCVASQIATIRVSTERVIEVDRPISTTQVGIGSTSTATSNVSAPANSRSW
jgi:hypothetical protein